MDPLLKIHDGQSAVVIGGGPSVEDYIDKIKELKKDGAVIVSIERMYTWCWKNDIKPDYVVALDASDDVVEGFVSIHPETIHLISTQCPPHLFDLMKDEKVYIFNTVQNGIDSQKIWEKYGYDVVTKINSGGSVTLGAFSIAMTLGCKDIHIFGFDCHMTNGGYANGIAGVGIQEGIFEVEVGDRLFKTNSPYLSFAQQFFDLKVMATRLGMLKSVKVYGDSLVTAMSVTDISGDVTTNK